MYAIVETGGKQFRVKEGQLVHIERLEGEVGDQVTFDRVLLVADNDQHHIGAPIVEGARVSGTIEEQGKDAKVTVFKFKRRKMYRRKQGHRQLFSAVRIDSIDLEDSKRKKASAKEEKPKKGTATAKQEKAKKAKSTDQEKSEEKPSAKKNASNQAKTSEAKTESGKKAASAEKTSDNEKKGVSSKKKKDEE